MNDYYVYTERFTIGGVYVPAAPNTLDVTVALEAGLSHPSPEQNDAIESLAKLELSESMTDTMRKYYTYRFEGQFNIPVSIDASRITEHCYLEDAMVPIHNGSRHTFVLLGFNCDWDPEYGTSMFLVDGVIEWYGRFGVDIFMGGRWLEMLRDDGDRIIDAVRRLQK